MNIVTIPCAFAIAGLALLAGADVKTDFNPNQDFSGYHSFAWKSVKSAPDGRVDNSLISDRIHSAVNAQLDKHGFVGVSETENPDLLVVYHINAKERHSPRYATAPFGYGRWGGGWGGTISDYRYLEGDFMIDLIDARTRKLVWRAYATDTGNSLASIESGKQIDKLASKAFEHFPPYPKH